MPVYNANRFLERALKSIARQTYKHIEIICVDDQSTDNSFAILVRFAKRRKHVRVYQLPKHSGAPKAANFAISKARGRFIARMDADDIMMSTRLEKQAAFLLSNAHIVAVGGQCRRMNETGKTMGVKTFPLDHATISTMLFTAVPIQQPTLMINMAKIPKGFTWYNVSLLIGEDYDLFYRLMQYGKLANLPDILIRYREHPNNLTLASQKKTFWFITRSRLLAVTKYGYVPTVQALAQVFIQTILVLILPDKLLYKLHMMTRELFFRRKAAYT